MTEEPSAPAGREPPRRRRVLSWRSQALVAVLCAALGFGIVAQVRQTQEDDLSTLRQDDLVRLLDEITQRNEALTEEGDRLRGDRAELLSGSDARRSAEQYLLDQAILAGTAPVEGPGVVLDVTSAGGVEAQDLVHVLEELRNAGAESIEIAGTEIVNTRIVASTSFVDTAGGVEVDGTLLGSSYEWRVVGDPGTLAGALEIAGGAAASLRGAGAQVNVTERPLLQITAIRTVQEPEFAVPVESED